MSGHKIRVLIVDDSLFFRNALAQGLSRHSDIEIAGEAFDPYAARDKILELEPDIMTLDVEMPNMNGVEFLKILLPQWEIPVIVVSSLSHAEKPARKAGAADFFSKPNHRSPEAMESFCNGLARRIRKAAAKTPAYAAPPPPSAPPPPANHVIALGASTGGTQATAKIIQALPADTPGMVVVQHMPPDFTKMYAEGMDRDCRMSVSEACDGDMIERGRVLVAPGGLRHLEVRKSGDGYCVSLKEGEKVSGHCPSVDVLFRSMARVLPGRTSIGVLLTGMGADGARGLLEMRNTGAYTIGQDERTSVVYGMPKEAYDMGAVVRQAPLDAIAGLITKYAAGLRK